MAVAVVVKHLQKRLLLGLMQVRRPQMAVGRLLTMAAATQPEEVVMLRMLRAVMRLVGMTLEEVMTEAAMRQQHKETVSLLHNINTQHRPQIYVL